MTFYKPFLKYIKTVVSIKRSGSNRTRFKHSNSIITRIKIVTQKLKFTCLYIILSFCSGLRYSVSTWTLFYRQIYRFRHVFFMRWSLCQDRLEIKSSSFGFIWSPNVQLYVYIYFSGSVKIAPAKRKIEFPIFTFYLSGCCFARKTCYEREMI